MKRNITITLEEELAKEAKVLAAQKDTSVSQLLADYLESILKSEKKNEEAKEDFFKLTRKKYFLNYSKRQFQRDALHER
ncbi:MAG: hypothetical protein HY036_11630 [Nitrospirae bacterium]|nr:hypothetical protein [Nitrospirota bacterium]MBI3353211.1 hypothetical protein [Nitrospirota bacterium]